MEGSRLGTFTLLFTDIEGSTRLARELGDRWPATLEAHRRLVGGAIAANGGRVEGTEGDAFFALFEDAGSAVAAAAAAQGALARERWPGDPVRVRMGLHTGAVQRLSAGGFVGLDIHLAARVGSAAHGGQVLLTEATRQLLEDGVAVHDVGEHRLKDFPVALRLFHLVLDASAPIPPPRAASVRPTSQRPKPRPLVGRDVELAEVRAFLEAPGPRALVLEGDPGYGKSALWEAGLAEAKGHVKLVARPAGGEAVLALAALGDLLSEIEGEALEQLSAPQRRTLRAALRQTDGDEGMVEDPLALHLAVLSLVQRMSERGPLLLAIDDAQWLDAATADVVAFVLRRLRDTETLHVLLAHRPAGRGAPAPLGVDQVLSAQHMRVGPVPADAAPPLVRAALAVVLPRRVLTRIHAIADGNPLHMLELARSLSRETLPEAGEDIALPGTLDQLVRERLEALPAQAQPALLAAALLADPVSSVVEAAGGSDGLDAAFAAGVVEIKRDRVRFTHPLLAAAVRAETPPGAKRRMHAVLADAVTDSEHRAVHLALSVAGPDAAVAAQVHAAALAAADQGVLAVAVELGELTLRVTPPDDPAIDDRRLWVAERQLLIGEDTRARELLEEVLEVTPQGPRRGRVLLRMAVADATLRESAELLDAALLQANDDPGLEYEIRLERSITALVTEGPAAALEEDRAAVALAERLGDNSRLAVALSEMALMTRVTGEPAPQLMERAVALDGGDEGDALREASVTFSHALYLLWEGHFDEALTRFEALLASAESRGYLSRAEQVYLDLSELHSRAGRYHVARALAERSMGSNQSQAGLFPLALAEAHLGDLQAAREHARLGLEFSRTGGDWVFRCENGWVLGFAALSAGDHERAAADLNGVWSLAREFGCGDPGGIPVLPDAIEALIAIGEVDQAATLAEELDHRTARLGASCVRPQAVRCRGQIAAARGDLEPALNHFADALVEHERVPAPFERGRTLLARGVTLRRAKRQHDARGVLQEALAIFEELSTPLWAQRTRDELARASAAGRRTAAS